MNEAEVTTEELRELIRQGHAMLGDINRAQKEVRKAKAELLEMVEEYRNAPREHVEDVIRSIMSDATARIAVEVSGACNEATALVQKEIYDRFDVLMSTILGVDEQRGTSIPDQLRKFMKPEIDWDALAKVDKPIVRIKKEG